MEQFSKTNSENRTELLFSFIKKHFCTNPLNAISTQTKVQFLIRKEFLQKFKLTIRIHYFTFVIFCFHSLNRTGNELSTKVLVVVVVDV